jgi:hypothetical protein
MVFNMATFTNSIALTCLFLSACGSTSSGQGAYRPAIIQEAVDMDKYEADRSSCEKAVRQNPSNMESTNSIRFRDCLVNKNYKLLG